MALASSPLRKADRPDKALPTTFSFIKTCAIKPLANVPKKQYPTKSEYVYYMRGHRYFFPLVLFALFLFFTLQPRITPASGQPLVMESEDERLVRWDLTADSVVTFNDEEIMEASGNVVLRRGQEYLKADFARYYMSTKWVYLRGNVYVSMGKDEIKAEEAEFDLRSRVGWLKNGRIFMAGPHAYISGERIDKHWGDVYTFRRAKATTCDGDVPAWSLTAEEAVLEIDGYARLVRSSFQVKDKPVAYTPFFLFPTKTKRQTGLLQPEYGISSTKGVFFNQPFFWAINESSDLTLNEYIMADRGFMHGIQYRATPTSDTSAWIRFDWMHDRKVEDNDRSGDFSGDGLLRTNNERYWLRGMLDTRLKDPEWRLKADLDYVSDQYYLSEFKNGFSGFNTSRSELFSLFNRDLQEKNRDRVSGFLLTRDWDRASVALSSTYTQNPVLGHGNTPLSEDTTVQSLPQVDAYLYKGRIVPSLPLEVEATAQAAYMYRRSGTKGARYEVFPKISLPYNTRYGSIIATAGLRQTLYDTDVVSNTSLTGSTNGPTQTGDSRTLPEFSVAGFTEFAKVYALDSPALALSKENSGKTRWAALRHSIQPRLEFAHRVNEDQDDNPYYINEDRIDPRTELVYSITNVLTVKREQVVLKKNEEGETIPTLTTNYHDILRLRLRNSYDIREANRNNDLKTYERRPFGDIFADLVVSPNPFLSFSTRNDWSPYEEDFIRHQSGVRLNIPEYGSIYAGYDRRRKINEFTRKSTDDIDYLRLGFDTAMFGPFTLSGYFYFDYKDMENRETDLRLTYNHQCFQVIGSVSVEPQEETYQLMILLTGLGD